MPTRRSPALLSWKHELRCTDDGVGVDAEVIDRRLGALGVEPPQAGQRGLFGRGLRDVWLAQGAGRIEGIRGGRLVESWFFPAPGDEPYAFVHVRDRAAGSVDLRALAVSVAGTRVTVPLAAGRLPAPGRLRALVSQLVRLRPILEDPTRAVLLEQPGHTPALVTYPAPEPDGDRPVLFDDEVEIGAGVSARITVRRAKEPLSQGFSRATRRGGLVIRSGRAAHETTLAARKAGYGKKRVPEYVPYRMLEVEAAANTVYAWAAEQILARRGVPRARDLRRRRQPQAHARSPLPRSYGWRATKNQVDAAPRPDSPSRALARFEGTGGRDEPSSASAFRQAAGPGGQPGPSRPLPATSR